MTVWISSMNRMAPVVGLQLLDHLLEPLFEVAAVACAGEQRAHVEREHRRVREHVRHFAVDDAPRQTFRDGGLADAGIADEQRVVLLPAAEDLYGAVDLLVASDQRIDLAVPRLLVEVDAIGLKRVALLLCVVPGLRVGVLIDAAYGARLGHAGALGDAVADVVDRVVAGHVLLLQEVGSVALPLGEDRDQDVGAGDLFAAGRLHVDNRALDHALEASRRLGVVAAVDDQVVEFGLDVAEQVAAQLVEIDVAGAQYRRSVLIVDQRQKKMLERRVFVMPLVGESERPVQRLLETTGEGGHTASWSDSGSSSTSFPSRIGEDADACGRNP